MHFGYLGEVVIESLTPFSPYRVLHSVLQCLHCLNVCLTMSHVGWLVICTREGRRQTSTMLKLSANYVFGPCTYTISILSISH